MRSIGDLIVGRKLYTIVETASILTVVQLMVKRKVGALPVTNKAGQIIGIFTERDLLKRVVAAELDIKQTLVSQVMTRKLITADVDETSTYCLRKMKEKKIRHILVAKEGEIIGIISQRYLIEVDLAEKRKALQSIDA
ncbi:MAG: CBS domain-containing protein [Blastocatellia bacterium]